VVFWDITLCGLVDKCCISEKSNAWHLQERRMKMEAADSSEILVVLYQIIQYQIPED
jgi:hypothetical protein